jgi:acyl-CoA synthetase (AMP-forming)/AMP-acid ligase II
VRLTYSELDQQARAIAALLQDRGATNEPVLLLHPPSLDYIAAFFGCLYAGAIAVPAYPPHSDRTWPRIRAIIKDTQARIILSTSETLLALQSSFGLNPDLPELDWIATNTLEKGLADAWQPLTVELDRLAFLQYTSGSTGSPKGVMVAYSNIRHNLNMIERHSLQNEHSQMVSWLPPYHDLGLLGGILYPIHVGFPSTLATPVSFLQRPFRWLQTISEVRCTMSLAPNFALDLCCRKVTAEQRATLDLSSWEVMANGGEPVRKETLDRFTAMFQSCGFRHEAHFPGYGMAETTLIIATDRKLLPPVIKAFQAEALERNQAIEADDDAPDTRSIVGYPHMSPDQHILIVDPQTFHTCQPGQVGEIWTKGPSVTQGYWQKPVETARTFQAYTADTHDGPFLRTGDLGFMHDGMLFVTGRAKDVIIVRGHNHYPQDIEQTLEKSHPAIRQGCSVAFSIEADSAEQLVVLAEIDPRFKACQNLQDEQAIAQTTRKPLNPQEVTKAIRAAIVEEHDLQTYRIVLVKAGSILKTSSGKLQRRACRQEFLDGHMGAWDE